MPPNDTLQLAYWKELEQVMKATNSYEQLEAVVQRYLPGLPAMNTDHVLNFRLNWDINDKYAQHWLPILDPFLNPFTVHTTGDGGCFSNAASRMTYGHEQYANQLRMRMVIEGVLHAPDYVNHNKLQIGFETFVPTESLPTLDAVYTMLSAAEQNKMPVEDRNVPLKVFQRTLFEYRKPRTEAGLWAFNLLANVTKRPILSMYHDIQGGVGQKPGEHFAQQWDCMNRIIYPFDQRYKDEAYGAIAWSGTDNTLPHMNPNHFVSVVP